MFLASAMGEETLRENVRTQEEQGAEVELMETSTLRERYPWINTEGVTLASRGGGWLV